MTYQKLLVPGLVSLFVTLFGPYASAHDDGLTCHTHEGSGLRENAVLDFALTGNEGFDSDVPTRSGATHFSAVVHRFDNLVESQAYDFNPREVLLLRAALSELEQSVVVVSQILEHSDRSYLAARQEQLEKIARRAHAMLKLDDVLPFSAFRSAIRGKKALTIDLVTLKRHLIQTTGAPESLMVVLDQAAQSC